MSIKQHFPNINQNKDYTLQSYLFGHRIKSEQTLYEYLIEFLQVMISEKYYIDEETQKFYDYFPIDANLQNKQLKFSPKTRVGLKRFIFYRNSKMDSKFEIDQEAYNLCIEGIKSKIDIEDCQKYDKEEIIDIIQNLFLGMNAVIKNRAWFAQSLLPICKEAILPESMGDKKTRKKLKQQLQNGMIDEEKYYKAMENEFEYTRYNFMVRGGEVYYLHLLRAINKYPEYKNDIEKGFENLINNLWQFSALSNFIYNNWLIIYKDQINRYSYGIDDTNLIKKVEKNLGTIPIAYDNRCEYTLIELKNFLSTNFHIFDKYKILSYGIVLQLIRMMNDQISNLYNGKRKVWIIDMGVEGKVGSELKKLGVNNFNENENMFIDVIYKYAKEFDKGKGEQKAAKEASDDSYKLIRKLGKQIGLIVPLKGDGMRFTLTEDIIKFLVLSIIPPSNMYRIDTFLLKLYEHYGIIIDRDVFKKAVEKEEIKMIADLSILDENKQKFIEVLKNCGFVRDLSDATSIVENPFEEVIF